MSIRDSEEYKAWEQVLKKDVANIRDSAQDRDPKEILMMEIACLNTDIVLNQNVANEISQRFAKQAKFLCLCALVFLEKMREAPSKYRELALLSGFDDLVRIPRSDPFMVACLHVYKWLIDITGFPCMDIYDYRPYYHARADNLRIAIRAHRRWQKHVLNANS